MLCPHCGEELSDNTNFCEFCGEKLADSTSNVGEITNQNVDLSNMVPCQYCGEMIPSDSKVCQFCGKSFNLYAEYVDKELPPTVYLILFIVGVLISLLNRNLIMLIMMIIVIAAIYLLEKKIIDK